MMHSSVRVSTFHCLMMVLALCGIGTIAVAAEPHGAPNPPVTATAGPQAALVAQSQPAGPAPKYRCDEPDYNFGKVWAMEKVEHTFIIHNDGQGELIVDVKPTCGCTVAEFDKKIAPGGQGKAKTILTTGNYTTQLKKIINVETNDPAKRNAQLSLSGEVKQKITTDPAMFGAYFGQLTPDMNLTKIFKLTNNTEKPMKIEIVAPAVPSCFKATVKELEAGKVAEITVAAEPPFKEETNTAQFTIKTGLENTPDMTLPCSLIKPPTIQVQPPMLRLPPAPLTSIWRQPITVRNNGNDPIQILSVEANEPTLKITQTEPTPGKLFTLTVEAPAGFSPDPARTTIVTIKTSYKDRPVYTVPILPMTLPRPQSQPAVITAESLIGRPAPSLGAATTDGQPVKIGAEAGQIMVVNFWASWCTQSREQIPMLDQLYQTYRRRGVEFLNVSVEQFRPATEVAEAARGLDSKIPVVPDMDRRITRAFGVNEVPLTVVIGKNGTVEAVTRGIGRTPADLESIAAAFQERLDKLLDGRGRGDFTPRPIAIGTPCRLDPFSTAFGGGMGAPLLAVEALKVDAGQFKPKSKAGYRLYFRNTGTVPLELKNVRGSEGLTIDPAYPKSLAPGSTAFLQCTFETPAGGQQFAHQVVFESNDRANPVLNMALTGKSKPMIELQPLTGIDFASRARTFSVPRIATLIYNGPDKVDYKPPQSSSPKFTAELKQTARQANVSILTVKAIPPFEPGEAKATITIETSEPTQPKVEVPVRLYMPARVEVKPAALNLVFSQTIQQATVSIVNSGESALSILEVKKSKPNIQTQFYPEPDGMSYRLQVTIPPGMVIGPEGEKITIRTDDKQFGEIVIPIKYVMPQASSGTPKPGLN